MGEKKGWERKRERVHEGGRGNGVQKGGGHAGGGGVRRSEGGGVGELFEGATSMERWLTHPLILVPLSQTML